MSQAHSDSHGAEGQGHCHSHGPEAHAHSHGPHSHSDAHDHDHDHDIDDDGDGHSHGGQGHGHSHGPDAPEHYHPSAPGTYDDREPFHSLTSTRNYGERAFTIGIGGPVGSGKTALVLSLCRYLRDKYQLVVVTNDIFTKEDCEFLIKHEALGKGNNGRIRAIETGGCPHAAIREDCSSNLVALEQLTAKYSPIDLAIIESGGDNLAANYSRELADYIIYVIDVAGGDKVPRKGGPGITQSDLLVINKTDLAALVGADLELMERQAKEMRRGVKLVSEEERKNVVAIRAAAAAGATAGAGASSVASHGPIVLAQVKHMVGVEQIANYILEAWQMAKRLQNRYKTGITI